jgi:hypothetical protein
MLTQTHTGMAGLSEYKTWNVTDPRMTSYDHTRSCLTLIIITQQPVSTRGEYDKL